MFCRNLIGYLNFFDVQMIEIHIFSIRTHFRVIKNYQKCENILLPHISNINTTPQLHNNAPQLHNNAGSKQARSKSHFTIQKI